MVLYKTVTAAQLDIEAIWLANLGLPGKANWLLQQLTD